jgi:ABC-type Fe3+ transport system substrate-binding protein
VAIVKGTRHRDAAMAFVEALVSGRGQDDLRSAGFEPPPGG